MAHKKPYLIVSDFNEANVRKKSQVDLPLYFREWPSIKDNDSNNYVKKGNWQYLIRKHNSEGYPPFDMFSDWLMDFATITSYKLDKSPWQKFNRLILVHVPDCQYFCWYCFNDAWKECAVNSNDIKAKLNPEHIKLDYIPGDKIVKEFLKYREKFNNTINEEKQRNVLRISGGEPFIYPELITEIAVAFEKESRDKDIFLWVDTNLHLIHKNTRAIKKALDSLSKLDNKVAIHACIHGGNPKSLQRNTGILIENSNETRFFIYESIDILHKSNLDLYLRINPVGLKSDETINIFKNLYKIDKKLPAKTYLGPIELYYPPSEVRMQEFIGNLQLGKKGSRGKSSVDKEIHFHPKNVVLYQWNKAMEAIYGFGYGKVPRGLIHKLDIKQEVLSDIKLCKEDQQWEEVILISKGWALDIYKLKTLEILALPNNSHIYIEFENIHIEPSLVFFINNFKKSKDKIKKWDKVLIIVTTENFGVLDIFPLRYGKVIDIKSTGVNEKHSVMFTIQLQEYADDMLSKYGLKKETPLANQLAKIVGFENLPWSKFSYFCNIVGLPVNPNYVENSDRFGFQEVILSIVKSNDKNTLKNVYYRVSKIKKMTTEDDVEFDNKGRLKIKKNDDIRLTIESCNPYITKDSDHPSIIESELEVLAIPQNSVTIYPKTILLSKYGEVEIGLKFEKYHNIEGHIVIRPINRQAIIASIKMPFIIST